MSHWRKSAANAVMNLAVAFGLSMAAHYYAVLPATLWYFDENGVGESAQAVVAFWTTAFYTVLSFFRSFVVAYIIELFCAWKAARKAKRGNN